MTKAKEEFIQRQRKELISLGKSVHDDLWSLELRIPRLIELMAGVGRDNIYAADPNRRSALTAGKVCKHNEHMNKLDEMHKTLMELKELIGSIQTSE